MLQTGCLRCLKSIPGPWREKPQPEEPVSHMQMVPLDLWITIREEDDVSNAIKACRTESLSLASGTASCFNTSVSYRVFNYTSSQNSWCPITEQTELLPGELNVLPTLQFPIYYDIQASTLSVTLISAANLPLPSSTKHKDVFVNTYLHPHREV